MGRELISPQPSLPFLHNACVNGILKIVTLLQKSVQVTAHFLHHRDLAFLLIKSAKNTYTEMRFYLVIGTVRSRVLSSPAAVSAREGPGLGFGTLGSSAGICLSTLSGNRNRAS